MKATLELSYIELYSMFESIQELASFELEMGRLDQVNIIESLLKLITDKMGKRIMTTATLELNHKQLTCLAQALQERASFELEMGRLDLVDITDDLLEIVTDRIHRLDTLSDLSKEKQP